MLLCPEVSPARRRSVDFARLRAGVPALALTLLLVACGQPSADQSIASAKGYLAKRDGKAAAIELKTALQAAPDSPEARLLLAQALAMSKDPVSAVVEFDKAAQLKIPPAQVVPDLTRALNASRQFRRVTDQYASADLQDPGAQAALKTEVAQAYAAQGQMNEARTALQAALRARGDYPPALVLQARLLAEAKRFDDALAMIDKATATAPADASAFHYKGQFLFYGKGDAAGALAAYRKSTEADPDQFDARTSLMSVLLAQGDVKGAAAQVDELRKRHPNAPQTRYAAAQLAFYNRDYKAARELAQQLLQVAPDSVEVLQLSGALEFQLGGLVEAERFLSKALQLNPQLPVTRQLLARTYLRLGQPEKARTTLKPLLNAPDDAMDAQTVAIAAEADLLAGDLVDAEAKFTRASKMNPADTKNLANLALTHVGMGRVDAGVSELEAVAKTRKDVVADMALATLRVRQQQYGEALKAIDGVEAKQPNQASVAELRGRVEMMRKDPAAARRDYERALSLDPAYLPAVIALASLDMADKRPEQARKRFEAVLQKDPSNVQALVAIAGLRAREGAAPEEVAGLLANAVKLNPSEPEPRLLLIDHYLSAGDLKAAVAAAQQATASLPEKPDLWDAYGRVQLAAGEVNQAIISFGKLASLRPDSALPYLRLAQLHAGAKNNDAAMLNARRALGIDPKLLPAQQLLVGLTASTQRYDEALKLAREVQRQRPDDVVGWLLEGGVETARKNFDGAAAVYRAVVKRFDSGQAAIRLHSVFLAGGKMTDAEAFEKSWLASHPQDAAFLFHLGVTEIASGDAARGAGHFKQVVAIDPENAVALNNLAWAMVKSGQPGAVPVARKATSIAPNAPTFLNTLAEALAAENEPAQALEVQRKALALAPDNATQRLNLARLYLRTGDKPAARAELETLAKLGKAYTEQAEARRLLKTL